VKYLLEEAYETAEAIEDGDDAALREELGDVLLQVVFHARIAQDAGDWTSTTSQPASPRNSSAATRTCSLGRRRTPRAMSRRIGKS